MTAKKMGRPPSEAPRTNRVMVRFNNKEFEKLDAYCAHHDISRAEAIRKGVMLLLEKK